MNNKKLIKWITRKVAQIRKPVANEYATARGELKLLDGFQKVEYMPSPFEIADYYGIDYKFVSLEGSMPSYLSYTDNKIVTIYISDRYRKESYMAKLLCAHELGHYFLHDIQDAAMNNDILNYYLPDEIKKEYEANVFAIILMPQIMGGHPWEKDSPRILNRKVYKKVQEEHGG